MVGSVCGGIVGLVCFVSTTQRGFRTYGFAVMGFTVPIVVYATRDDGAEVTRSFLVGAVMASSWVSSPAMCFLPQAANAKRTNALIDLAATAEQKQDQCGVAVASTLPAPCFSPVPHADCDDPGALFTTRF